MATFYTDSNQRVGAPMMYLREHSYPETSVLPSTMMLYMNSSGSYSDTTTLGGGSNSQQQPPSSCIDIPTVGGGMESNFSGSFDGRDPHEMLVMNHHHPSSILHNSGQGLSLSLGTQIPGGFQMPSSPTSHFRNSNMGLVSFLSPNPDEGGGTSRNNNCSPSSLRNENSRNIMEYVQAAAAAAGFNQDSASIMQQQGAAVRSIPNSRYLKAAQQLLEEVVNVRKALKQADEAKEHQSKENEGRAKSSEDGDGGGADSSSKESAAAAAKELSHSEKQELQNKLTKLLTMLDEVDKRYKQYYHQMQFVVSSFDAVAGAGAAKPYTALALQRISRHFRCLRDAITGQIQAVRKSLGEQDSNSGVGIARLRYVDQQLRQQRALQQLGMMQPHAWRPQRGLPESSVSILRAWLFEHFLHPYPKDSDKIMLARQTGLTRSQVSNWFINARVRLWKPMVEEMYKEETGDTEMDSNSSSENAIKALNKADIGSSEDRGEDMMMQKSSSSFEKLNDPRSNHHHHHHQNQIQQQQQQQDIEMVGSSGGAAVASFLTGARNIETEYNVKLRGEHQSLYHQHMSDAETAFHMSELGRFGSGTGVSLTLGLQHFESGGGGGMSFSGGGSMHHHHHQHHGFVPIRGDDEFYSTVGGSSGDAAAAAEYDVVSNNDNGGGTQQQQLLHDFVA